MKRNHRHANRLESRGTLAGMNPPRFTLWLRIAWSVACFTLGALLVNAWVNAGSDRVLLDPWFHFTTVAIVLASALVPWLITIQVPTCRFSLRAMLIATTLVAAMLGIGVQQYQLAVARTSFERMHEAWKGLYATCEEVIMASEELRKVECRSPWSRYADAEVQHLNRLKQLLKEAEAMKLVTLFGSKEASEHDVNVLRKAISDIEQP
jgi:hypothetical protein